MMRWSRLDDRGRSRVTRPCRPEVLRRHPQRLDHLVLRHVSYSRPGAASSRPSAERRAARSGSKSSQAGEYLEKLYDRHQPRNSPWRVRGLGPVDWKKLIRLETERGGDLHDDAGPRLDLALLDPDDLAV